ncbi:hypothetical protein MT340_001525 [Staphylococcus sp. NRL 16/872]|uniref:hypothetical protein n=1 Tax=Staphylococcus sp. NRL 16/872 TaxID=2930131 RepID=UPI001FB4E5EF|nr:MULTISPECIES: hypothetical protein [unclassified Staphylococcus]MCJ1661285.1 hypothetical protein [Staphylococcus sp. NRL 18/288]MCJ1667172.1 hypothetical protein [Staphylococcus sp. NRL 19/737]WEN69653.1 hypothetical protein MT340_001525 [Staphylococcus sp. NRL 16/872]
METLRELFKQLDYWENYAPRSYSGSMMRVGKRNEVKRQIFKSITVEDIRKYILNKK